MEIKLGSNATAKTLGLSAEEPTQNGVHNKAEAATSSYLQSSVESGVVSGFQLATANGPLCDEPMWGVIFEAGFFAFPAWTDPTPQSTSHVLVSA